MKIDEIDQYLANERAQGTVIILFDKNKNILFKHVYNNSNTTYKVTDVTRFGIASITKSITALAILKLHQQQLLNINDPINKYLPSFNDSSILIKHFLNHTSGFYPQLRSTIETYADKYGINLSTTECAYNNEFAKIGQKVIIDNLNNQNKRHSKPGENISYFNDGYGLLSEIIRLVSPYDSYGEYLNNEIFEPLKMHNTTVEFNSVNNDPNTTNQFFYKNNELQMIKNYYDNAFVLNGGGAIKSTVYDLMNLVVMYLNKDKTIVSDELLEMQYNTETQIDNTNYYGYGLQTEYINSTAIIGHNGALTGVSSSMVFSMEDGIGCVVLCNTSDCRIGNLAKQIICDYLNIERKSSYATSSWTNEKLLSLYGKYSTSEGYSLVIDDSIITIENKTYSYQTLVDNQILIKSDIPQIISLIVSNNHVTGIRYGLRILEKLP